MITTIRLTCVGLTLFLACAPASRAQSSAQAMAKYYNAEIGPINDQIDDLRSQLNDPNLSMQQAAQIVDQESALRRKADALWDTTQGGVDGAYDQLRGAIDKYNKNNRRLDFQSAIAGSQIDLLNNAARNPNKGDFERNNARVRQRLGTHLWRPHQTTW